MKTLILRLLFSVVVMGDKILDAEMKHLHPS